MTQTQSHDDFGWPVLFGRAARDLESLSIRTREKIRPELMAAFRTGRPGLFRLAVDGVEVIYQVAPIATGQLVVHIHEVVAVR